MNTFIVAEINKSWDGNWDENTPLSELINRKFEHVINVNYNKGYKLFSWRFTTVVHEGIMNETIIAIFVLDKNRIKKEK